MGDTAFEHPEVAPFWEACEVGELRVPRCSSCEQFIWYPAPVCRCGARDIHWQPVSGRATLFTWVTVHRAFRPELEPRVPYVTALVELVEDPTLRLATLLAVEPGTPLRLGQPLEVFFEPIDGRAHPCFRPAGDST